MGTASRMGGEAGDIPPWCPARHGGGGGGLAVGVAPSRDLLQSGRREGGEGWGGERRIHRLRGVAGGYVGTALGQQHSHCHASSWGGQLGPTRRSVQARGEKKGGAGERAGWRTGQRWVHPQGAGDGGGIRQAVAIMTIFSGPCLGKSALTNSDFFSLQIRAVPGIA